MSKLTDEEFDRIINEMTPDMRAIFTDLWGAVYGVHARVSDIEQALTLDMLDAEFRGETAPVD